MLDRFGAADVVGGLAKLLAVIAVGLPIFGIGYVVIRTGAAADRARCGGSTAGHPGRRVLAAVLAAAVAGRAAVRLVAARQLPPDPVLRAGHPRRRAAGLVRRPGGAVRAGRGPAALGGDRLAGRRRARCRPPPSRPCRWCWCPADAVAGRVDRADLGVPVQPPGAARGGGQPGAGGEHHERHRWSTTSRSRWCGPTPTRC